MLISAVSLAVLILWDQVLTKKHRIFQLLQGPVVVVMLGILASYLFRTGALDFSLRADQLVNLPVTSGLGEFIGQFTFPALSGLLNPEVYKIAVVIAIVASLETLLCVEATDKLDPLKRVTPANRELKAQGIGNVVSGLIGGLPVTQVIVRSSANIAFGAKSRKSAIMHGFFLLISAITIAGLLNMIPLSSLAAVLIMVGYKLAKPALFTQMYRLGWEQFAPFTVTVIAILLTDLLMGITIGLGVGLMFTLHHSYRNSHFMKDTITLEGGKKVHYIELAQEVSFFNKASIIAALEAIPANSKVIIDCTNSKSISYDVVEFIRDFPLHANRNNIEVETINFIMPPN